MFGIEKSVYSPYVENVLNYETIKTLRTLSYEKVYAVFVRRIEDEYVPLLALEYGSGDACSISSDNYKPEKILLANKRIQSDGVVLVHNHPRYNNRMIKAFPSRNDVSTTIDIHDMLEKEGCCLLDHIIVNEIDYYSFFEKGLIKN